MIDAIIIRLIKGMVVSINKLFLAFASMFLCGSVSCASSQNNSAPLSMEALRNRVDLMLSKSNECLMVGDLDNARRFKIMAIAAISIMLLEQSRLQIVAKLADDKQ